MNSSYQDSIKLLTRRDYSRYKLKQKLLDKGHSLEEIEETISLLLEKRYLREDYYKEARIRGLIGKGLSARMIQQRLAQENCEASLEEIDLMFQEKTTSEDEQVKSLIAKKLRSHQLHGLDPEARNKLELKVLRFLHSKGHSGPEVRETLRTALSSS